MSNKSKTLNQDRLTLILATLSILLVSVAVVLIVRAFLTSQAEEKTNEFWPMTYTDTNLVEPEQNFDLENGATTITKNATVENPAGLQKKPVCVRMAVVCKVYDEAGINVSNKFNCEATFTIDETKWQEIDGFYYYKSVLMPGVSTTNLFNSEISISNTEDIPSNYQIKIDVIADTVQAVETDSADWKASDITANCACTAWGVSATLTGQQIEWA